MEEKQSKIKTIFGIMFALLICSTAFAQTKPNPESDFKLIIPEFNRGDPYYVYVGKSENIVIPKKEFYSDWLIRTPHTTVKVKSVVIPEGVTEIGNGAFYGCENLVNVKIPKSVTLIGANAFNGCSNIKEITIPDSVTSIGDCAFYGCSGLKEITIPPSVKKIGTCAFYDGISNIIISADGQLSEDIFTYLSDRYRTNTTLKNVILLEGVTYIPDYTFKNCTALTSVTIPSTVTEIRNNAFEGCERLENVIIPEGVTTIGAKAFYNCKALTSVTIPEGVTTIGDYAFKDCENLINIIIPSTVTKKGDMVFEGCKSLETTIQNPYEKQNPFENSENFTPHITKGKMDITMESIDSNGETTYMLCIDGNTGVQNKDNSDYWEASCKLNFKMKNFIQDGYKLTFKAIGDGNVWALSFVLYDDDKPIYYKYEFSTKKDKAITVKIPYRKLKLTDKSVKHNLKIKEVCDVIISGNNPGQETNRSLWIYNVKVY